MHPRKAGVKQSSSPSASTSYHGVHSSPNGIFSSTTMRIIATMSSMMPCEAEVLGVIIQSCGANMKAAVEQQERNRARVDWARPHPPEA